MNAGRTGDLTTQGFIVDGVSSKTLINGVWAALDQSVEATARGPQRIPGSSTTVTEGRTMVTTTGGRLRSFSPNTRFG